MCVCIYLYVHINYQLINFGAINLTAHKKRFLKFSGCIEDALNKCDSRVPVNDVESARRLLEEHHDMKRTVLEAARLTIEHGESLLDRMRTMSVASQNAEMQHATTAACAGIERLLDAYHDRRRHLEELWNVRHSRLEVLLTLCQLDSEMLRLLRWYDETGDPFLRSGELGESLTHAQHVHNAHMQFELAAQQTRADSARLVRAAGQLLHLGIAPSDVETIRSRLRGLEERSEAFAARLDDRRTLMLLALNFFKEAQIANQKLDAISNEVRNLLGSAANTQQLVERYSHVARWSKRRSCRLFAVVTLCLIVRKMNRA